MRKTKHTTERGEGGTSAKQFGVRSCVRHQVWPHGMDTEMTLLLIGCYGSEVAQNGMQSCRPDEHAIKEPLGMKKQNKRSRLRSLIKTELGVVLTYVCTKYDINGILADTDERSGGTIYGGTW